MKQFFIIFITLILASNIANGQFVLEKKEIKDTAFTIPMLNISYARQWSAGDLADRFGSNNNLGVSFMVKTKKNWVYGLKSSFLWGAKVRDNEVLQNLVTENGFVIDNAGRETSVFLGQRGFSAFLFGGRMINKFAPNKNSGILVYGGFGMLQHKISIKFQDDIAALSDDLKKGYDRYSVGYAANGFVGYLFMSKNRLLNFFGGFDYTYGRTKSWRKFNYDTQKADVTTNTDILYGVRIGWIIRLNSRKSDNYYYQ